jgi:hypothetical protein
MRKYIPWALTTAVLTLGTAVHADDAADKLLAQKTQAEANWKLAEGGEMATSETAHLLIYVPKTFEKNLKDFGTYLEKYYARAAEVLGYDAKKAPWDGKLAVYLFAEREQFQAFVRRVEKRRVVAGETASHAVDGDLLHAAAGPSQSKDEFPAETQAAQQVATAMLSVKAGPKVPLPEWLMTGFGRAATYRVTPQDKFVLADRRLARDAVAKKRTAKAVYNDSVDADEMPALSGALADLLTTSLSAAKFADFLAAFKPDENGEKKMTEPALDVAGVKLDRLEASWKVWVANPK